jgi:translation initiation factor IF-1
MPAPKKRSFRRSSRSKGGKSRRPQKKVDDTPESEKCFEVEGSIAAVLAGTMFRVKLDGTEHTVLAHISGKMRKRFIRLVIGDRVKLEMSPYDTEKARIVYRLR